MRMAAGVEEAGFWLPSEFLTDDDFMVDKQNFSGELDADFCFPSEFPYHFETHADNLLQLQKSCAMSASPRSTLAYLSAGVSSRGSPVSVASPPTMPMAAKYDAVEDLIYLAAGHVAKLRGYASNSCPPPPRHLAQFHKEVKISAPSVYPKFQNFSTRAAGGLGQIAWTPHPIRDGGAAAKKACAGTGVFLPSPGRYNNISVSNVYSSGPRRKQGCTASSSPFVRASPQIYTKPSYTSISRFVESQPEPLPLPQPMAPRHAAMLQRRSFISNGAGGSLMIGRDHQCLPPEWTY